MIPVRKLLTSLLILCSTLSPLFANQGLYISRTEHDDGDGRNAITQKGGMASFVYPGRTDRTYAFWFKRDLGADDQSSDPNRGINSGSTYLTSSWVLEAAQVKIPGSVLPNDGEWHYFMLRIDNTGAIPPGVIPTTQYRVHNLYLYLDGDPNPIYTREFDERSANVPVYIGAQVQSPGGIEKSPTNYNFILDDFATWQGFPANIFDQFLSVSNFGMDRFDAEHPNLLSLLQFESDADSLNYLQDDHVDNGPGVDSKQSIGNNYYDFVSAPRAYVDTSDNRINKIEVTVESEYGINEVAPAVGISVVDFDISGENLISFKAPEFVYLDRFGNELGSSDDDQTTFIDEAFYRARLTGYTLNGAELRSVPSDRVIQQPATEDMTVTWLWELQYAVILEMAVGANEGLTSASGNASTEVGSENELGLGKKWATVNDLVSSFIDGSIGADDPTNGTRYAATGVIVENAPPSQFGTDPDNFAAVFSRDGGYLNGGNTGVDLSNTSFTIEFWSRLDPSNANSDQNIISFGENSGAGEQLRIGFRSNASSNDFFIANNASGTEIDDAALIDHDWHHWAVVYDLPNTQILIYRDGQLVRGPVLRNFDFSPDAGDADFLAIGARATNNNGAAYIDQFPGSLDNVRVWSAIRTQEDVVESMNQTQAFGATTALELELTFDTPSLTTLTSTEGKNLTFNYQDAENLLPVGNALTNAEKLDLFFTEQKVESYNSTRDRNGVEQIPINDWVRIQWQWEIQHKISLAASAPEFQEFLFLETETETFTGLEAAEQWVSQYEDITLGGQFRTSDRCFTLTSIQGNQNISVPTMVDGSRNGAVSREWTIQSVVGPEIVIFGYDRTIFRAEVPLGEGLFADTDLVADLESKLVPNLCDGGALHLSAGTPPTVFANADLDALQNGGSVGQSGRQFIWDSVGRQLLPLVPGTYRVDWPDANGNGSYLVELVVDFPTLTRSITHQRENDDGTRQRANDDYVYEVTLDSVDNAFVASPAAHYRHLYSSDINRQPPVDLDPSPIDRWKFDEMTYSTGGVTVDPQSNSFSASTEGKSVLLYSYALTGTATGDDEKEAYAVRVVESAAFDDENINYDNDDLGQGSRQALYANETDGIYARPVGEGDDFALNSTATWEFWAKLDEEVADPSKDRVAFEIERPSTNEALIIGFHGPDHPTNPNALFTTIGSTVAGTDPTQVWLENGFAGIPGFADESYWNFFLGINEGGNNESGTFETSLGDGEFVTNFSFASNIYLAKGPNLGALANDHGFSFNVTPEDNPMTFGADGASTGLVLRFDTDGYQSGGSDGDIHLVYDQVVVASANNIDFLNPSFNPDIAPTQLPFSMQVEDDGKVTVNYNGTLLFDGVQTDFSGGTDWNISFVGVRRLESLNGAIEEDLSLVWNIPTNGLRVLETATASDLYLDSNWHHYALVQTPTSIDIHIDGRAIGTMAINNPFLAGSGGHQLRLGYSQIKEGCWLNGYLDDFGRWDSARSVSDIRDAFFGNRPDDSNGGDWWLLDFDTPSGSGIIPKLADSAVFDLGMEFKLIDSTDSSTLPLASSGLSHQTADFFAEVATRIRSKYDTAGFQSGYLINETSNYNASVYDRLANVGTWGPIFPVNWSGLYRADNNELGAIYYENPFMISPFSTSPLHPNVAWPYSVITYDTVTYPVEGEHKDKRIFVSSRLGTEGVDANGIDQLVVDPATYNAFTIYNQPETHLPGYNPNEEHATIHSSIKPFLTGDNSYDLGQEAAFAMQRNLNIWGQTDQDEDSAINKASDFTSEPWVLVQYQDATTDEWYMAAYEVLGSRDAGDLFPALDSVTHEPIDSFGQPVTQPSNPSYDFEYATFAGNLHLPPYPLNQLIGAAQFDEDAYGNLTIAGNEQRTLWFDINNISWVVSGNGRYYYRHHYPLRNDFWYDLDNDGTTDIPIGDPVPHFAPTDDNTPQHAKYNSFWKTDYPVLKRGESLTYQGGEFSAENPDADGLPAVVGWAAGQVVYDNASPSMELDSLSDLDTYTARLVRPLDRIEVDFAQADFPQVSPNLTPSNTDAIQVVAERWYFKALTGSLQKRLYYDTLNQKLVFRGRLNDLESGDPNLTAVPVSLHVLEPNYMTKSEYHGIFSALEIATSDPIGQAITSIFLSSQNPNGVIDNSDDSNPANESTPEYLPGVQMTADQVAQSRVVPHLTEEADGSIDDTAITDPSAGDYSHLQSLGSGSALIPNPTLLEKLDSDPGPYYLTLAENNHPDAGGAITIHVIQIGTERLRGAIKLIEAANVFDEKINLQHNADFGGNSENIYYEWWYREVESLHKVGLPGEDAKWLPYAKGLGLHKIEFSGNPTVMLSDNLFYVRYGHEDDFDSSEITGGSVTDDDWRLVDLNDDTDTYVGGAESPFQWAGASNSPQLQADGSLRYIPQLVMGWVKRVLDRVNPYEARYSDFFNNESPATYSSQIQIAGKPFIGKVALNSDKDAIENVGLIELYETVLARAKELSLELGTSSEGINQAVLLASTRLAFLYELLGKEAYSDAQDATISVTTENGLSSVAPYVHAFYNQEASLLNEELALLRGTDFVKAYPSFNRLFWNYVKGEGEAAYNSNYNIYDVTEDGFINEFDAAELYPQGHGDSWGHLLSANKMHYELLRNSVFDWEALPELYSLLDNVIEADYLDEKTFSRVAAAKARAGDEIVKGTYRLAYVEDPDSQWQGYTDTANPARAWGVSEWAKRSGQASYFDWITANLIAPAADANPDAENLERINRLANQSEIGEIAGALVSIQRSIDDANNGFNPIGLDKDAVVFDLDPLEYAGAGGTRKSHFEQAYEKAVSAAQNALVTFEHASQANQNLRKIADDTSAIQVEALRQDIDYRNRLIEIFGRPYTGNIGPGQVYAEGYEGPDTLLYNYLDRTDTEELIATQDPRFTTLKNRTLPRLATNYDHLDWDPNYADVEDRINLFYERYFLAENFGFNSVELGDEITVEAPVNQSSDYAFRAEEAWGSRSSYGRLQETLNEMLLEQITLQQSVRDYAAYIERVEIRAQRLQQEFRAHSAREDSRRRTAKVAAGLGTVQAVANTVEAFSEWGWDFAWQSSIVANEALPTVLGLSNDPTFVGRTAIYGIGTTFRSTLFLKWTLAILAGKLSEAGVALVEAQAEHDEIIINEFREMNDIISELSALLTEEEGRRLAISQHVQRLQQLANSYQTTLAEGFRLLEERESFNMVLASNVQKNRYADMISRLARNETMGTYQDSFEHAVRYAWLAAKAYDYETSLDPHSPAAATTIFEELVRTRMLGLWEDGQPRIGKGGLANALAQLKANFDSLEGQLGINNPQVETGKISLRHENFRIKPTSDDRWKNLLNSNDIRRENLWDIPEFRTYCRPFASPEDGPQPGLVLEFNTVIESGLNLFGHELGADDQSYSASNFATKVSSAGVWFEGYSDAGLATAPRIYLVPVGSDSLKIADSSFPIDRHWNVVEQRIPAPYVINESNLGDVNFIPSAQSVNGSFTDIRRFGDFRAYPDAGDAAVDTSQLAGDSRLIGRSIANSKWLLIIPGATLHSDADYGLDQFIENIDDIKLVFETYSHQGQ